jgi:hypothetical protein
MNYICNIYKLYYVESAKDEHSAKQYPVHEATSDQEKNY